MLVTSPFIFKLLRTPLSIQNLRGVADQMDPGEGGDLPDLPRLRRIQVSCEGRYRVERSRLCLPRDNSNGRAYLLWPCLGG